MKECPLALCSLVKCFQGLVILHGSLAVVILLVAYSLSLQQSYETPPMICDLNNCTYDCAAGDFDASIASDSFPLTDYSRLATGHLGLRRAT